LDRRGKLGENARLSRLRKAVTDEPNSSWALAAWRSAQLVSRLSIGQATRPPTLEVVRLWNS
jgi:hypothetical protein